MTKKQQNNGWPQVGAWCYCAGQGLQRFRVLQRIDNTAVVQAIDGEVQQRVPCSQLHRGELIGNDGMPRTIEPRRGPFNYNDVLYLVRRVSGWMSELELVWLMSKAQSLAAGASWLELGSWCGRSLLAVGCALPTNAKLFGVDLGMWTNRGDKTLPYQDPVMNEEWNLQDTVDLLIQLRPDISIGLYRGTTDSFAGICGAEFDVIFIDAGHEEQTVTADLAKYFSRAKELCGHDYDRPGVCDDGVKKAVDGFAKERGLSVSSYESIWSFGRRAETPNGAKEPADKVALAPTATRETPSANVQVSPQFDSGAEQFAVAKSLPADRNGSQTPQKVTQLAATTNTASMNGMVHGAASSNGAASGPESTSGQDCFMVDFDPTTVAIAMTTAPRRSPTLESSLKSLRDAGFSQTVHLFVEPGTLRDDWSFPGVVIHQNAKRLGCFPNWLEAADWLLEQTSAPYLMVMEDDGVYCRCAAAALYYGLLNLKFAGGLSLYTPLQNYLAGGHDEAGWLALQSPERWGTVAQCFHRDVLKDFVVGADRSQPDGTDRHLEDFFRREGLAWYCHAPSLADHVGICSTIGHRATVDNSGIGFDPGFSGYQLTQPVACPEPDRGPPAISIVLPVYNGQQYLRESIDSCLNQSFAEWELIIVDDGSTDETAEILSEYCDSRILVIHHGNNRKLPAALNTGFRQARGKFLTWTSCDNRYHSQALGTMLSFLERHPETDLVYSDFDVVNETGKFVRHHRTGPTEDLPQYNSIGMCFLYRRHIYDIIGDYDLQAFLAEDYDYWLRAANCFRLTHLPKRLYDYREHPASLTARFAKTIPNVAQQVRLKNAGTSYTVKRSPTGSDFMICMAACGNGAQIGMQSNMKVRR